VSPAFLGTSDFAAAVLRRLADSPHRPSLVVTPPDSRRGRGRRVGSPPAADAARELGIDVLQVTSVNEPEAAAAVREADPGIAVVCAFGQLIKEPLLGEVEMLNVHPSLLPRWRGAAPIERAIMAGDPEAGVCVMRVTAGLDSGPVALCESTPLGHEETFGDLWPRLADLGGGLIVEALDRRAAGELELTEQDDARATYAEKIEAADRRLDPSRPAEDLAATVRALTPHIGAYLELDGGGRLGVRAARAAADAGDALDAGELRADGERLLLGTAHGLLQLDEVQPPGGRAMLAADYLRGHAVPARAA
jgi:methionyl-tRNA formyltransferase